MDRESTTFGLGSEKLVRLFDIGSKEQMQGDTSDSDKKSELLHDILAEPVPLSDSAQHKLDKLMQTIDVLSSESLGKLLLDPETNITLVRQIKDYGRKLSSRAECKEETQVSNTIYYGAIASAMVFHKVRITRFSNADLAESFQKLADQQWIPEFMRRLFEKSGEQCLKKESS